MGTSLVSYSADHRARALAFNARLEAAGVSDFHIPRDPPPRREAMPAIHREWFVLLHDDEVRGGLMLQRQPFWVDGRLRDVRNIQSPVTEGMIDKRYSTLAVLMMRALVRQHPLLFGVGMGSVEKPFPRLLSALRWKLEPVPFYFRVVRSRRVLRQLTPLRGSAATRMGAGVLATTGLGSLAVRVAQGGWPSAAGTRATRLDNDTGDGWGAWANEIWEEARESYAMIGLRDRAALEAWYPVSDRYLCHAFSTPRRIVGWSVTLDTQMRAHKYFGDLRVGTILDALCVPGHEADVVRHTALLLKDRGVDLIVANFNQARWIEGLNDAAFVAYRSNYLLGCSPQLCSVLEPVSENWSGIHLTRGDGDGRIHL